MNDGGKLPRIPPRSADAHKGDFGHVLVVGGSPGMTGAPCMAALAAQKSGAGLVTVGIPETLNVVVEARLLSVMSWPLEECGAKRLGSEAATEILQEAEKFDICALGPGLGRAPETQEMVRSLVTDSELPLIIDADGLNALAADLKPVRDRSCPTVLTPHPGEMKRLVGAEDVSCIQHDRSEVARRLAREVGAVVVLKGSGTVVTDGGEIYVNLTGNPGMATGGMGDVLTGVISALACQGLDSFDAARLGVFVHGLAGDLAARKYGAISVMPEDVLNLLPVAFLALGEAGDKNLEETFNAERVIEGTLS